jgi:branched-chain amino acid transport system permease protein
MVAIMVWRPRGLLAHREPTIRLHGEAPLDAGGPARL